MVSAAFSVPLPLGIPFILVILGIAILPMIMPAKLWEKGMGVFIAICSLGVIVPFGVLFGGAELGYMLLHAIFGYIAFIALIFALYTTAGGVVMEGAGNGTPMTTTLLLLFGAVLASIIGTTGASMLLVRPLLRSVRKRKYKAHAFMFLIFLVSNIGGALTPIGDPPVFLGFLLGVDFFWPLANVAPHWALATGILCILFLVIDTYFYNLEMKEKAHELERRDLEAAADGTAADASDQSIAASEGWSKYKATVLAETAMKLTTLSNDVSAARTESELADLERAVHSVAKPPSALERTSLERPGSTHSVAARGWHRLRLRVRVLSAFKPGLSRGEHFHFRGWFIQPVLGMGSSALQKRN